MNRFRARAAGLGLALVAGSAVAADGDWHAPGHSPTTVEVLPGGAPNLLPPLMGAAPAKADPGLLWLPAQKPPASSPPTSPLPAPPLAAPPPAASPLVVPATGGLPVAQPDRQPPTQSPPEARVPVGPRAGGVDGPLPAIPVLSEAAVPAPEPPIARPAPPSEPIPHPRPIDSKPANPPMMVPPHAPEFLPSPGVKDPTPGSPLPPPRPVDTPPRPLPGPAPLPDLQPAPPGLLYPAGAAEVMKSGSFCSPPIRLSCDYPPIRDMIRTGHGHNGIAPADEAADGPGGPLNRFFVSGEYLLWWLPGFPTPVLATTNPNTALNGFLGEPGTTAIVGPGSLIGSTRSGVRIRAGAWFDDCGSCGIGGGFFILPNRSASPVVNSTQFPLITRPVFVPNLVPGTNAPLGESGESVAVPNILRGTVTVHAESQLWGADVNLRKNLLNGCDSRAEVFAGYRYLNLRESLAITENITVIGPGGTRVNLTDPIGTQVFVQDRFATRNEFNGGQLGGLYERRWGRWSADVRGSIALGDTHQTLDINGIQVRQPPGAAPMTFRGGLLAAGPNLGHFTSDRFSVVPELTLNVGYRVTDNLRVFAGYNVLLWTNVIRPGDQIDRTVDLTFVPNALPAGFSGQYRPHPLFTQRDLVVNGIQFGLDWRW